MFYLSLLLATGFAFQSTPTQTVGATEPPARPAISTQERGDIFMARKMYREAVDTYKQAPESALMMRYSRPYFCRRSRSIAFSTERSSSIVMMVGLAKRTTPPW